MSILTTAKTNIPSKVHFTEYIATENAPKESRLFNTSKRPKQADAAGAYIGFQRHTLFMRSIVRFFHV